MKRFSFWFWKTLLVMTSCVYWTCSLLNTCANLNHLPVIQNKKCKEEGGPLLVLRTRGVVVCVRQCMVRTRCKSVSYDLGTGHCELNTKVTANLKQQNKIGSVCSDVVVWPQDLMGVCYNYSCSEDSYCDDQTPGVPQCVKEEHPNENRACAFGLHYSPARRSCSEECVNNSYRDTFDDYISYELLVPEENNTLCSYRWCKRMCLELDSPPCRFFQHSEKHMNCYVSSRPLKWDDRGHQIMTGKSYLTIYTRQCNP